jgi:hypothetical protein
MTCSPFSLLPGWRAALLLVAVVCAACGSPGRAAAECGDHVTILNRPTVQPTPEGTASPAAGVPLAPPMAPCSGPNCSGGSERHPAPLAPVSTAEPPGKAVAAIGGTVEPPGDASSRVGDLTTSRPIRRATSVFHPPRAG